MASVSLTDEAALGGGLDRHLRQGFGGEAALQVTARDDLAIGDRPAAADDRAAARSALVDGNARSLAPASMRAMRPAAPARLKTGKVIQTDQLPPVTM